MTLKIGWWRFARRGPAVKEVSLIASAILLSAVNANAMQLEDYLLDRKSLINEEITIEAKIECYSLTDCSLTGDGGVASMNVAVNQNPDSPIFTREVRAQLLHCSVADMEHDCIAKVTGVTLQRYNGDTVFDIKSISIRSQKSDLQRELDNLGSFKNDGD